MGSSTSSRFKRWLPVALCCLPGLTAAGLLGVLFATGGATLGAALGGRLGLTVLALTVLACPLIMLFMARARPLSRRLPSNSQAACCAPDESSASDRDSTACGSTASKPHRWAPAPIVPVNLAVRKGLRLAFMPRWLRLWGPALVGVPGLLALGIWGGAAARFLLFTHHLFYLFAAMLLINPVAETFWPAKSSSRRRAKRRKRRP